MTYGGVGTAESVTRYVERDRRSGDARPLATTAYRKQPPGALRFAWHVLANFSCVLGTGLLLLAVLPAAAGYRPLVVTSGSMAPAIRTADVVVTTRSDGHGLQPGAVIEFDVGAGSTLHRVVGVESEGYRTAGDANRAGDSTIVPERLVRGVGMLVVPLVGHLGLWASEGRWGAILLVVALGAMSFRCSRVSWLERDGR